MLGRPLVASVSVVLAVGLATVVSLLGLAAPAGERDTTIAARPAVARITPVRQVQHPTTLAHERRATGWLTGSGHEPSASPASPADPGS